MVNSKLRDNTDVCKASVFCVPTSLIVTQLHRPPPTPALEGEMRLIKSQGLVRL